MSHYIKITSDHNNCTCSACGKRVSLDCGRIPTSCEKKVPLTTRGEKITGKENTSLFNISFVQTHQSFSLCWDCLTELSLELTYAELQERMKKAYPIE